MLGPAQRESSGGGLRLAAAVLAGAPVGFAAGALFGARALAADTPAEAAGGILAAGLFGALFCGAAMALLALLLPPRPVRIATLVAGAVSFAILVYMVQDFVSDRMARAQAFDAAYAGMVGFELALAAKEANRRPFSSLVVQSETRAYEALRPGGWRCEGRASRAQTWALYQGLQGLRASGVEADCERRASWRIAGGEPVAACLDGRGDALFAAADRLVEDTERRASCRRAGASP